MSIARAGSQERADCLVTVRDDLPSHVDVRSKVQALYGTQIVHEVASQLAALGAGDLHVLVQDQASLPFTLAARVETAVRRLRPQTARSSSLAGVPPPAAPLLLRTRLYVPASTAKFIPNAHLYGADALIFDLEDSVLAGEKDAARILLRHALQRFAFGTGGLCVRINPLPDGLEDLREIAATGRAVTLLLPKTERAAQVDDLRAACLSNGFDPHIMPIIESARGVLAAGQIAAARGVCALAIGLEDYTADLGVPRTRDGVESAWACGMVVNAAAAAGVPALASVFSEVDNEAGLRDYATRMRGLGFAGIGCIHPGQIGPVHDVFAPTAAERAAAQRVLDAFDRAQSSGVAVVQVDGRMVDAPVAARARRMLAL